MPIEKKNKNRRIKSRYVQKGFTLDREENAVERMVSVARQQHSEEIIAKGEKYEDPHFLPNIDSIINPDESQSKMPSDVRQHMAYLRWYRPSDIFGDYELFRGINPGDIE